MAASAVLVFSLLMEVVFGQQQNVGQPFNYRLVSGPNVCRGKPSPQSCCPGWEQKATSNLCVIPVCRGNCGGGLCIKPNFCQCLNGVLGSFCPTSQDGCKNRCLNGGVCKNTVCQCQPGYRGTKCETPICSQPCTNGGKCVGHNQCACVYGFTGNRCQADYRQGPCYVEVRNQRCHNQLAGVVCTKAMCCATIGQAWGSPCERCSSKPEPCQRGYLPNFRTKACQDVDECRAIPNVCKGAKCINTIGSFKCQCADGMREDKQTKKCTDIDECKEIQDVCGNGRCENTEGSYKCTCSSGYILSPDAKTCVDASTGFCYQRRTNGQCSEPLSFKTTKGGCCCLKENTEAWGDKCEQCPARNSNEYSRLCGTSGKLVDQCKQNVCPNGRCEKTQGGGYRCTCNPGYVLGANNKCEDENECQRSGICRNGKCINTDGSYNCACRLGYVLDESKKNCKDRDECDEAGICENGRCTNNEGSFSCVCDRGYEFKGSSKKTCTDINECSAVEGLCKNGRCVNTAGGYQCICNTGFDTAKDGRSCLERNECSQPGVCKNGQCIDKEVGFQCICNKGFALSADERTCIDVDECHSIDGICENGFCVNGPGSYRCACNTGYAPAKDGKSCVDDRKSYCYTEIDGNSRCSNPLLIPVSRTQCCCGMETDMQNGGRRGWGRPCQVCPLKNTDEYKSLCKEEGMDSTGKDIDECKNNVGTKVGICENGRCQNMMGDYKCICNAGYTADETNKLCNDIDECAQNPSFCYGGTCRNLPGTYRCDCPEGFAYDSVTQACEDIDECSKSEYCQGGRCINTEGSFICQCQQGLTLSNDRKKCEDRRLGKCWTAINEARCEENANGVVLRVLCCQTVGLAWGSPCETCLKDTQCGKGYAIQDQQICTDIDECKVFPSLCRNARCINTKGSFICQCPRGLTLDSTGRNCLDLRKDVCYRNAGEESCENPFKDHIGKASCCCSVGAAWGRPCQVCPLSNSPEFRELCPGGRGTVTVDTLEETVVKDIDECSTMTDICLNGKCENTVGSFRCSCNSGFALDSDGQSCIDIDECGLTSDLCGNGTCTNVPGMFRCNCYNGYQNAPMMMEVCIDIDECAQETNPCSDGICVNTAGSFRCECQPGMTLMANQVACVDIDECQDRGLCVNGRCENFVGDYQCSCNFGFEASIDMKSCVDIDECLIGNGGCLEICNNTIGGFSCGCTSGYAKQPDGSCKDIDECALRTNICGEGNECTNIEGGYVCNCREGYVLSVDKRSCIDIDECQQDPRLCSNGVCKNTPGSFRCICGKGFHLAEITTACVDIDECKLKEDQCNKNSYCVNSVGSFNCECKKGYLNKGKECLDIDECAQGVSKCSDNGFCVNTDGSFSCRCDSGYTGDGYNCVDINECLEDSLLCENGQCINAPGAYTCECELGYNPTDNLKECIDIDECEVFPELCTHGRCVNYPSQFECVCDRGFQLTKQGNNCTDVDECSITGMCPNGKCVNKMGAYECICDIGFMQNVNKSGCLDMRKSVCYLSAPDSQSCKIIAGQSVYKSECCCAAIRTPDGLGWNSPCEVCPKPGTDEYAKLCPGGLGFRANPETTIIQDINECEKLPLACDGGKCVNSKGNVECICKRGFKHNKGTGKCEDINECKEKPYICGFGGICTNTEGGHTCDCPADLIKHPFLDMCLDERKRLCYVDLQDELDSGSTPGASCDRPVGSNLTIEECCCTFGTAYGKDCLLCPQKGTDEFISLCGTSGGEIIDKEETGGIGPGGIKGGGTTDGTDGTGGTGGTDGTDGGPSVKRKDVNECELYPNLCLLGRCVNTKGSYKCICPTGYMVDETNTLCKDTDECTVGINPCVDGQCRNTFGSFICDCSKGYKIDMTGLICEDVDECKLENTCQHGTCTNSIGSYSCKCPAGFTLGLGGTVCTDINECDAKADLCGGGTCINRPGTYECSCNKGYKLVNKVCVDKDECAEERGVCRNGICRNTVGGFVCQCNIGFTLTDDKKYCRDMNECTEIPGYCARGNCINTIGGSRCECPSGFELSPAGDTCIDVNECDENPDYCQVGGQCVNTEGSFQCICPEGYRLGNSGRSCVDVRKSYCFNKFDSTGCTLPRMLNATKQVCCCSKGAGWGDPCEICPSRDNSNFAILCPKGYGYEINGQDIAEDINECLKDPSLCKNGRCVNIDGSYRCQCSPGYKLDSTGANCIDIDECEIPNSCGNGTCYNRIGTFSCACKEGFAPGATPKCEDIDECRDKDLCAFRCVNIPASFFCVCPRGYELASDKKFCKDLDECSTNRHNCPYDCKNFFGGFKCTCPPGYRQRGQDCIDIDECSEKRGLCANGQCRNIRGGYVCDCDEGYKRALDGKSCEDLRRALCFSTVINGVCQGSTSNMMQVTRKECCCTAGKAWGRQCEVCPAKGSSNYRQMCTNMKDMDECHMIPGLCANGKCINTRGSYRCMCNPGYKLTPDGTRCIDLDECGERVKPCSQTCQNTEGSYKCTCPAGFITVGQKCQDVDECTTRGNNCQYRCLNTIGSYKCMCPSGYRQQGTSCVNDNECQGSQCQSGCQGGRCQVGGCQGGGCQGGGCQGYQCGCPSGFTMNYLYNQCVDINECQSVQVCGQAVCVNTHGSYSCSCRRGLTFQQQTRSCVDVNECMTSNPCNYGCQNNLGGFRCSCPTNYYPAGGDTCVSTAPSLTNPSGESCYQCEQDRRDGDDEGVPLVETNADSDAPLLIPQGQEPYSSSSRQRTQYKQSSYSYSYSYKGSGQQRSKRSTLTKDHKLVVHVPLNISIVVPIIKLVPVLSSLNSTLVYRLARGDSSLFKFDVHDGLSYLHIKRPIPHKGTYRLFVKAVLTRKHHKVVKNEVDGVKLSMKNSTNESDGITEKENEMGKKLSFQDKLKMINDGVEKKKSKLKAFNKKMNLGDKNKSSDDIMINEQKKMKKKLSKKNKIKFSGEVKEMKVKKMKVEEVKENLDKSNLRDEVIEKNYELDNDTISKLVSEIEELKRKQINEKVSEKSDSKQEQVVVKQKEVKLNGETTTKVSNKVVEKQKKRKTMKKQVNQENEEHSLFKKQEAEDIAMGYKDSVKFHLMLIVKVK